jgi:Enoyl-CoA hydratase/carnithine racemase
MDENPVLVEKREGYRVITLNRPQRLNAFNEPMQQALVARSQRRRRTKIAARSF